MTRSPAGEDIDPLEVRRLELARAGDEIAFAALVRTHQDRLYRVALRMTGDSADAQDVVQETLLQAWQHLPGFRGEAGFGTWVTRILINRCHNLHRARRPVGPLPEETDAASGLPHSPAAETVAVTAHSRDAVRRALLALPLDQRAPLVLTTFAGYTFAETGRILGISEGAAKVRAHRARRTLATQLQEWSDPMTDHDMPSGDRLPCGEHVDDLLHQVIDGTPPRDPAHQAACPHCRATLTHLTELWAPVAEMAQEDVRAPAGLLQAVMAEVRTLARAGWSAVLYDEAGRTHIAARVVGAIARLAAESVPHVSLALGDGRIATPAGGNTDQSAVAGLENATDIGLAGDRVVVDVQIAVDQGVPMLLVAQRVRDRITEHLHAQTGLTTTEVNVIVVDVRLWLPSGEHLQ